MPIHSHTCDSMYLHVCLSALGSCTFVTVLSPLNWYTLLFTCLSNSYGYQRMQYLQVRQWQHSVSQTHVHIYTKPARTLTLPRAFWLWKVLIYRVTSSECSSCEPFRLHKCCHVHMHVDYNEQCCDRQSPLRLKGLTNCLSCLGACLPCQ